MKRGQVPPVAPVFRPTVFVVDTSVAIKWYLPEPHRPAARRLLAPAYKLHVPDLFFAEVGSVIWKKACRLKDPELTVADGRQILAELLGLPLSIHPTAGLLRSAYELASRVAALTVYDACYLALTIQLGAVLVTADRKLVAALGRGSYGAQVVWVEDLDHEDEG